VPKGVNYPLYLPESCAHAASLIASNQVSAAIESIQRVASDGDNGAAALLAYLHLRTAVPEPDFASARPNLDRAAKAGDPFAEFVMGLASRAADRAPDAIHWMSLSANHSFGPALAQLGRFMANGFGFPAPARDSAWKMYKLALKHGHVPTLTLAADLLRTSKNPLLR